MLVHPNGGAQYMVCSTYGSNVPAMNLYINCPTLVNVGNSSPFNFRRSTNTEINTFFKYQYSEPISLNMMFESCTAYNGNAQSVLDAFPNVYSLYSFLYECHEYNRPLIIPNTVTNCDHAFFNCRNLNSTITLRGNITSLVGMFKGCDNHNFTVDILGTVGNCANMFQGCYNFCPSELMLPNTITNSVNMFQSCFGFNGRNYIPSITFNGFNADARVSRTFTSANHINIIIKSDITNTMYSTSFISGIINNLNLTLEGNLDGRDAYNGFISSTNIQDSTIICRGNIYSPILNMRYNPLSERNHNNLHIETSSFASAVNCERFLQQSYANGSIYTRGDINNYNGYDTSNAWYYTASGFEFVPPYSSYSSDRRPTIFVNY